MSLRNDLYQNYGVDGSSEKMNKHIDVSTLGWGVSVRAFEPADKNVLIAEHRNITLGEVAFNLANVTPSGAIIAVDSEGEITLDVETLVGGSFSNDTILIYFYDNGGVVDVGFKSSVGGDFTPGDPNTYPVDVDYELAEITTTTGMTAINQSDIKDVRNIGALKSFAPEGFSTLLTGTNFVGDTKTFYAVDSDDDFIYCFGYDGFYNAFLVKFDYDNNYVLSREITISTGNGNFRNDSICVDDNNVYIALERGAVIALNKSTFAVVSARNYDDTTLTSFPYFLGCKILNGNLYVYGQEGQNFNYKGFCWELNTTDLSINNSIDYRRNTAASNGSNGAIVDITTDGSKYWLLSRTSISAPLGSDVIEVDLSLNPIAAYSCTNILCAMEYNDDGNLSFFAPQDQYTFDTSYTLIDSIGADTQIVDQTVRTKIKDYLDGKFYLVDRLGTLITETTNIPYLKGNKTYDAVAGIFRLYSLVATTKGIFLCGNHSNGGSGIGPCLLQIRDFDIGYFATTPTGYEYEDSNVDEATANALNFTLNATPSYNTLTITETDITGTVTITTPTPTVSTIYTTAL